ncbi:MAG: bifunctional phosphoserine phosphatase/homoserine phosphotransferase ThrH [Alphaproteobacteria bacterium]|nr:bifunctional phosphoserine phosphatase/homoserine phosphotransferase ThrH [Alphaproteobacteria bacterium]MBF0249002.1 bifunctional phosphoserine phosphatase/homoserine phosphotransferase ThrH [Alphaproteobacteria bacterium]
MRVICLDMEGVLVPEIWLGVAAKTGIEELRLTTRDIRDYDELMRHRLKVMDQHGIKIDLIQDVIGAMGPMDGAKDFLDELRTQAQVIILSDTFYDFAKPLMEQLGWPTLFCHYLDVADDGRVAGYRLRTTDHKTKSVKALRELNFITAAMGDSYNDTGMIQAAHVSAFFHAPQNVLDDFPGYPHFTNYEDAARHLLTAPPRD